MHVVIAGGHGKIGRRLGRLLVGRGDVVTALIRNPDHREELLADGLSPLVLDLERATAAELTPHLAGADAVVFAAGAGPGSGAARKYTVDRDAAVLLADAAVAAGVRRYLMISTRGAGSPPPPGADEIWSAYVDAKTAADEHLIGTDLDWTVLRPASLTDAPGTGTVRLTAGRSVGDITRDDVAALLVALLDTPASAGLVLEAAEGPDPVAEAVGRAAAERTGAVRG
ncbi:NAD(P)H-binding protein [Kitasatospora sp. NPDC094015]|uniref:NAD(P)H-binding protein n=1 Tax=Kitasatospora sp. NPDC094015 TaxID=3155205 RepID=UPI00331FE61B